MNDQISRKAAIDALGERPEVWIDDDEYSLGQRNQYDCDKQAIETVPSAQPEPCEDAVSRKAVQYLLAHFVDEDKYVDACDGLKHLPSVTPKHHWIPCSERLPYAEHGESDTVLATCGYWEVEDESIRWIRMLYYDGGNWCFLTGAAYSAKVYAWMPLPDPYREEGDPE